ncbi:MAG: NADP-dependent phosphogluconate dehydrogenase [bacterium]
MKKQRIGLVGLAVMGENLALNIEDKGFAVAVYNRTTDRVRDFVEGRAAGKNVVGTYSPGELASALEKPRRIIMMVKAGEAVDATIEQLRPHLESGDVLVDGGNSYFRDTARRCDALAAGGILYVGAGISGGEEGALRGPSIMPGGRREAYDALEEVLTSIAARASEGPCCAYIGPGGAGHFVKMVHNGIEYGDMQLIAEAYDVMKNALGMPAGEIAAVFKRWNEGALGSYLVEITGKILEKKDDETGRPLVDVILDSAGQKGTGKWTTQTALDLGVPTPTINAAVEARILSALKTERAAASRVLGRTTPEFSGDSERFIESVHDALYASKVCSYAQGMALLRAASAEYGWDLNLAEISRIWEGGCIIRARLLERIKDAFRRDPALPNLLLDGEFGERVSAAEDGWRTVVQTAARTGIPCLAFGASLSYFDSCRRERLPQNLTQAQRDFFGAHTYERTDKPGKFHTTWT